VAGTGAAVRRSDSVVVLELRADRDGSLRLAQEGVLSVPLVIRVVPAQGMSYELTVTPETTVTVLLLGPRGRGVAG
jgi:hypothetical protein